MTIFLRGDKSKLFKKCAICNKKKYGSNFHFNSDVCKECTFKNSKYKGTKFDKIKNKLERIEKWRSTDLGLSALSLGSEITVLTSDLEFAFKKTFSEAVDLYMEGKATVYSENTLYLRDKKNKYMRLKILYDSEFTCHYCSSLADTVDHIIPRSQEGKWTYDNLVACCSACNKLKLTMSYDDFLKSNIRYDVSQPRKTVVYNKNGIPISR